MPHDDTIKEYTEDVNVKAEKECMYVLYRRCV